MKRFVFFYLVLQTIFTSAQFNCGDTLLDVRNGKKYPTVQIGNQCWMATNLDIGVMLTDSMIATDNSIIEKYCYNDNPANCITYGGLYTWDEMMNYSIVEKDSGICPCGWYIPSDSEIIALEVALGMAPDTANLVNVWRGTDQGTQMLPGGASGLNILFAGARTGLHSFMALNAYGYVYSSSQSGDYAWRRCVRTNDSRVGRFNTFPKTYAFSVRCIYGNDTTSIHSSQTANQSYLSYINDGFEITLVHSFPVSGMRKIVIYDITGRIVFTISQNCHVGVETTTLPANLLKSGMYIIAAEIDAFFIANKIYLP